MLARSVAQMGKKNPNKYNPDSFLSCWRTHCSGLKIICGGLGGAGKVGAGRVLPAGLVGDLGLIGRLSSDCNLGSVGIDLALALKAIPELEDIEEEEEAVGKTGDS